MSTTGPAQSPSQLLQYLPAIYQDDAFVGQFLLAFEKILLGRQDYVAFPSPGLEETIANLASLFDPGQTPESFLSWLAEWTAFSLRADLDRAKQRDFVANIIPLYRWRGTKKNLQDLLSIFTVGAPTIVEPEAVELQIGVHSTVGTDTFVGDSPPHYFHVIIRLPRASTEVQQRQMRIVRDLIEYEKPAHTVYDLELRFPSMRIGRHSTVGVDTLLGTAQEED